MPHWLDEIPNAEGMAILQFLFERPGSTVREYCAGKGIHKEIEILATNRLFNKLTRMRLVEFTKQGSTFHYRAAMTREAFYDRCAKLIVANAFGGDAEPLRAARERMMSKRGKS